jgi:hypothetical protein
MTMRGPNETFTSRLARVIHAADSFRVGVENIALSRIEHDPEGYRQVLKLAQQRNETIEEERNHIIRVQKRNKSSRLSQAKARAERADGEEREKIKRRALNNIDKETKAMSGLVEGMQTLEEKVEDFLKDPEAQSAWEKWSQSNPLQPLSKEKVQESLEALKSKDALTQDQLNAITAWNNQQDREFERPRWEKE